jgi:4-hydroxy-tetrahydrodipicolinate synthase
MVLKLEGAFTAIVTPFTPDGAVDWEQLDKNVEFQIEQGINGLVPVGTTGECPTLTHDEHDRVIEAVIKKANKRVPVIAGTGSNSTVEAVRLTQKAKDAGADAALVVNPYYNKPNQEGLTQHFRKVAEVGLPIVLYNIPGRTGCLMSPQTIAKLAAEIPSIVAIKEATGSLDQSSEIASLSDITILSGDDSLTLPLMSVGAKGVISVLANLDPKRVLAITDAALKGDMVTAQKAHVGSFSLMRAMFTEVNPQPIKEAMKLAGRMPCADLRLPMVNVSEDTRKHLKEVLAAAKYI